MFPSYTETLDEFFEHNKEYKELIKVKFDKFPVFNLYNLNLSMWEMFVEDNGIKEIGAETEYLFKRYLNRLVDNLLVKYVPKIQLFIDNFNTLFDRKLKLSDDGKNHYYLNPMQDNTEANIVMQNVTDYSDNRDIALAMFKSSPEIMKQIFELQDLYNDCLNEFSKLFMGIL